MTESLRHIKSRIKSVENTWKITRAMEMISVSKLRRVQDLLFAMRRYFGKTDNLLENLLAERPDFSHPLLNAEVNTGRAAVCVVTSDSGLCGLYNDRVLKAAADFISRYPSDTVKIIAVGRKGFSYFKRKGFAVERAYLGLHGRLQPEPLRELTVFLKGIFLKKEVDEVYMVYTRFQSSMRYIPTIDRLFPVYVSSQIPDEPAYYLFEPDHPQLLDELLSAYVSEKIRLLLLEAFTAEHSERTIAMKSATDNAKDLIEGLVIFKNKVRQAAITKDVLEVISTVEALKG
ncbi:MAG: ATP synthase F1 subunit gamma [Candidatus Omnitrophica bacterium CG1_02_44_16]|nr:MAG: ATP synthase F1 subunit gamma [Candidatus Omnitrophica bacterium CG1_02_44_16]PIY83122.1 MAG: ATP synthase F1 subunit gamma [Candidatus Omnitrophica bacterium CG_4_10_14_0_8_um_filter_44_12]PIZ83836.1 MAG: ATP synthase F1 subunit gamma [Candidatus Omnitrophica bacterium CG_4_10_14_0_2_um_filter_44_9]